jgi:hypothetical protein
VIAQILTIITCLAKGSPFQKHSINLSEKLHHDFSETGKTKHWSFPPQSPLKYKDIKEICVHKGSEEEKR